MFICLVKKSLQLIVTELFIRGRKLNISFIFVAQSYFSAPKNIRLNSTHYVVMKILNKRLPQPIAISNSSDVDLKDFMILYKESTAKPYSFLVNGTTLALDHPLHFKCNLLERI